MNEIVICYSGGTDSTAAAALMAEKFDRLHLITYRHSGLAHVENSARNIEKLKELFGQDKFLHVIISTEKLYQMVTYANYLSDLKNHGLFVLSSCGLCHLAMHIRTLIYCLDHGITEVADGANKNSDHFPAQMAPVLEGIKEIYGRFGVNFSSPVFDYEFPEDLDWKHKFGLVDNVKPPSGKTTGQLLYEKGIMPEENVKGTPTDRKMQPRCFQLTMHNLFSLKYYIPRYGKDEYIEGTARFYKEKIEYFTGEIEKYLEDKEGSRLARVIEN